MKLEEYLKPTRLLDYDSSVVRSAVKECTKGLKTDAEKAVAIHNYVRDNIKFVFAPKFDSAKTSFTICT